MRWLRSSERRNQPLDGIRIFTAALELHGYVASTGQRITDILLRGHDLAFLPAGADAAPQNWVRVSPSDILVVIPPPCAGTPPDWLDAVQLIGLLVQVGQYQVIGTAHLRQGDVLDEGLRRRQPFLPLTGATIRREGNVSEVDVAIVSLGASIRFRPAGAP
jgi:hypothetical protein